MILNQNKKILGFFNFFTVHFKPNKIILKNFIMNLAKLKSYAVDKNIGCSPSHFKINKPIIFIELSI